MASTIVLICGEAAEGMWDLEPYVKCDSRDFYENANNASFNESKFFGTVCVKLVEGSVPVVINAQKYMSKKGGFNLASSIKFRGVSNPINYVGVFDAEPKAKSSEAVLYAWCEKNGAIMNGKDEIAFKNEILEVKNMKVTCGLVCAYAESKGHVTRAFGISLEEAKILLEENSEHISKKIEGEKIEVIFKGKAGGHVIKVESLGETAHITDNTAIKSVLSGDIVDKYNNSIKEFDLKDIDPTAKESAPILINNVGSVQVEILSWYCYAVESR